MAVIQVPPAVGTSGQFIDSIVVTSSTNRQIVVIGSPASTSAHATVDTDGNLHVVSASSGLIQLTSAIAISSGVVTATAATNPWSSAPGFNMPVVNASSGLVQVLTSGTLIVAMTSGTVTLSSNPTVITASSGNVGTFASTGSPWSVFTFNASSSNSIQVITTVAALLYSWNVGNQTTGIPASIKLYEGTTAPTAGSTTNLKITIPIPGSTAGSGNNKELPQGVLFSSGIAILVTANFGATSTGTSHSVGDIVGSFYYV